MAKDHDDSSGAPMSIMSEKIARPDVHVIAMECIALHPGDANSAGAALQSRLSHQFPAFYAQEAADAMRHVCVGWVRDATSKSRAAACYGVSSEQPARTARNLSSDSASQFAIGVMAYMVGMTPLGEATKVELLSSADRRMKVSRTEAARGQFERTIAERLPDDTTKVKKALKERDIEKIARECGVTE